MKIEDDLKTALAKRADAVRADDEAAWIAFERTARTRDRSRRVAAAVVAVAVAVGAFALVVRAFQPTASVQPSAVPRYSSVDEVFGLLTAGGAGCTQQGGDFGLALGLVDAGSCNVDGHQVNINIYGSPEAMQAHAQPPTTAKEWAGIAWVRGANWFVATDDPGVASTVQSILGGDILGGTGKAPASPSVRPSPPSQNASDPLNRPKLTHVTVVGQRVVGSSPDLLVVESPVGRVRWKLNKDCDVTGAPVGGTNAGGFGGGGCDGGRLAASDGGARVGGVFYDTISGHAYYGGEVTVRATFVDGTTADVTTQDGLWMIVFRPQPEMYSPASTIATVEAISSSGQVLDRVKVP
jgi:hypothetical protein